MSETTLDADELRRFFDTFAQASDALDVDTLADCFAEVFLAGDADGARPVPRPAFLQALPKRAQMFADAGIGPATLDTLTHQQLDDRYVLAQTRWTAPRISGGEPVPLSSSYLLHRDTDDTYRIVAYLSHQGMPLSQA
jgi:ketosteroid isomerase-like protein